MPGYNPDNININDLTLEEPEKQWEAFFDPERDITEENWQKMKRELEGAIRISRLGGNQGTFGVMSMRVLEPDFNFDLNKADWDDMNKNLADYKKRNRVSDFFELVSVMKLFDPKVNIGIDKDFWKQEKELLSDCIETRDWDFVFNLATRMKIVNPNMDLGIGREVWEEIKEDYLEHVDIDGNRDWGQFALGAMHVKLLNPGMDLGLDHKAWEGMKEELEYRMGRPSNEFGGCTAHVTAMKVLAADKAEITDDGLHVIMHANSGLSEGEHPSMPEQRKF